jgi:hypothetical protein
MAGIPRFRTLEAGIPHFELGISAKHTPRQVSTGLSRVQMRRRALIPGSKLLTGEDSSGDEHDRPPRVDPPCSALRRALEVTQAVHARLVENATGGRYLVPGRQDPGDVGG